MFTATITRANRTDQTLDVEVLFEDSDTGFSNKRVLNFNNVDIKLPEVQDAIITIGKTYKSAQNTEVILKQAVGLIIEI